MRAKKTLLRAPFPYFGGKSAVAGLVWNRFGQVQNYIEPFAGSLANLLARPDVGGTETVNDIDCYVANFWRATSAQPEKVAKFADNPVNETDLHARHRWLVYSDDAVKWRRRMTTDPDYFDAKIAGWWAWGLCCWIGTGWCRNPEQTGRGSALTAGNSPGRGLNAMSKKGAKANHIKRPDITEGKGVNRQLSQQVPDAFSNKGVHKQRPNLESNHMCRARPQLGDAFDIGRGVNSNRTAGTCAERQSWLKEWMFVLRDRLRLVRVCCGDWRRVCESETVTTRLGITGVFFDPPYSTEADRDMTIYNEESGTVAHHVRTYCLERGNNPMYRIALCGYDGEGHEELAKHGWTIHHWKANGGYANRSNKRGKDNAKRERIWFSPHCQAERSLFV